jgi:hypothetical protein
VADDSLVLFAVVLAAIFGFLSFLNTLGMHLAVRVIKVRVVKILGRIEKAMDDPVGYVVPIIEKGIQRLNDDKEFRDHIGGGIAFATRTARDAMLSKTPELDADGKPKPAARGWIKTVMELAGVAQQLGFLKAPKV